MADEPKDNPEEKEAAEAKPRRKRRRQPTLVGFALADKDDPSSALPRPPGSPIAPPSGVGRRRAPPTPPPLAPKPQVKPSTGGAASKPSSEGKPAERPRRPPPESRASGAGKPGAGKPGAGKPGADKPGVGKPGVGKPAGKAASAVKRPAPPSGRSVGGGKPPKPPKPPGPRPPVRKPPDRPKPARKVDPKALMASPDLRARPPKSSGRGPRLPRPGARKPGVSKAGAPKLPRPSKLAKPGSPTPGVETEAKPETGAKAEMESEAAMRSPAIAETAAESKGAAQTLSKSEPTSDSEKSEPESDKSESASESEKSEPASESVESAPAKPESEKSEKSEKSESGPEPDRPSKKKPDASPALQTDKASSAEANLAEAAEDPGSRAGSEDSRAGVELRSFPKPSESKSANEASEGDAPLPEVELPPQSGVTPAGLAARVDAALAAEKDDEDAEERRPTSKSIPAAAPLDAPGVQPVSPPDSADTEIEKGAPASEEQPTDPRTSSPEAPEVVTDPLAEPPPPREGPATQTAAAAYANTEVAIVAPPAMQAVTQLQGTPFPDDSDEPPVDPDGTEPTLDSPAALAGEPTRPLVQLPENGRTDRLEDAATPAGTPAPPILPATPTRASHPGELASQPKPPPTVVASGPMKAFLAVSFCFGAAGLSFFGWALYVTKGRAAVPEEPTMVSTPSSGTSSSGTSSSGAPSADLAGAAPAAPSAPAVPDENTEEPAEGPVGDPPEEEAAEEEADGAADGEHAPAAGERAEIRPFELEVPRLSRRARRMTVRQRRRQSTRLKAAAMRAYREDDFAEAERLYREAMEYNNWDVGAVEGLARATARQSRFDEAVAWAQLAVSRASRSPIAYRVLGDVWRQAGHPDEARSAYERGIARSPNDRWLRQRLRDIGSE